MGPIPNLPLVALQPVGFRLGLEVGNGLAHSHRPKGQAPQTTDLRQALRPSLVEPDDGGTHRLAICIDIDHRCPLSCERYARHSLFPDRALIPQTPAGLTQRPPHIDGVLLSPPRAVGKVGFDIDLVPGHQAASRIEEQGAHALGSKVDGKKMIG